MYTGVTVTKCPVILHYSELSSRSVTAHQTPRMTFSYHYLPAVAAAGYVGCDDDDDDDDDQCFASPHLKINNDNKQEAL